MPHTLLYLVLSRDIYKEELKIKNKIIYNNNNIIIIYFKPQKKKRKVGYRC